MAARSNKNLVVIFFLIITLISTAEGEQTVVEQYRFPYNSQFALLHTNKKLACFDTFLSTEKGNNYKMFQ
jgi:hypothetical protein